MTHEQYETLRKEYRSIVDGAAQQIIDNLNPEDERDLQAQFESELHEYENTHEWILDTDKAILVLRMSNHPCAEFFHHGTPGHQPTDEFPWSTLAGAAFLDDIVEAVQTITGLDSIHDESLRDYLAGK